MKKFLLSPPACRSHCHFSVTVSLLDAYLLSVPLMSFMSHCYFVSSAQGRKQKKGVFSLCAD